MIVQRGFPKPSSFHRDHLRQAADGHYFDVISNGLGRMFEYWVIIAYIRALPLS